MDPRIEQNRQARVVAGLCAVGGVRTWSVRADRLPELEKSVARLNRRAAKLGCAPIGLAIVATEAEFQHFGVLVAEPEPKQVSLIARREPALGLDSEGTGSIEHAPSRERALVVLRGSAPVIAGYSFLARVEHTDAGNLIARSPFGGADVDLTAYRASKPVCSHCNLARKRKDTFVLLETATSAVKQIGRQCLQDYLRGADPAAALAIWNFLRELEAEERGDEEGSGGGWSLPDPTVLAFIECSVASVRAHGFRKADNDAGSTKSDAYFLSGPRPSHPEQYKAHGEWLEGQPTDADKAKAALVLAWVSASTDQSDYFHNLRVAVAQPRVGQRIAGLIASTVAAYERALGIEFERKRKIARPASRHLGVVGASFLFHGTITRMHSVETDWGGSLCVAIETDAGEDLVTFASGRRVPDWLEPGVNCWVAGTVKRHSDYKGRPQTQLTRCRFEQERPPIPKVCPHCGQIQKTKKALVAHEATHAVQEVA